MRHSEVIEQKIKQALSPEVLHVENESHMHSVPENSETHFKLTVVARCFEGVLPVKRHQQIYGLLAEELANGVHALSLHLYTPQQWAQREGAVPVSPDCAGASKG
ncbi:BolA family protein [Teredinibacter purpureus]|uniref:BolA family protein n=1 Tax=Teredinibacter purpureus TaxID=2731756 RepID=UPI0005F7EEF5|nr:BolA/IbaG family iron-sulfur metabolism protein [Teredinibacter purpureus]